MKSAQGQEGLSKVAAKTKVKIIQVLSKFLNTIRKSW